MSTGAPPKKARHRVPVANGHHQVWSESDFRATTHLVDSVAYGHSILRHFRVSFSCFAKLFRHYTRILIFQSSGEVTDPTRDQLSCWREVNKHGQTGHLAQTRSTSSAVVPSLTPTSARYKAYGHSCGHLSFES